MPYYNLPFMYSGRNVMNMPEAGNLPEMQQAMPIMQQPMVTPPCLMQNAMPNMIPNMMPVIPPCQAGSMNPQQFYPLMPNMEDMYETEAEPERPAGDPPPILSNNPARPTLTLFKELTGYSNYGNPSGNADILYTGNRGVWTFEIPAFLFVPGNLRAQIVIRAVLDDHPNVPVSRYSARITVNGNVVHTGALPLEHGVPVGGRFTNWRSLTFNVNLRRNNRVVIENTSTAGNDDWIAFDWMELRLVTR